MPFVRYLREDNFQLYVETLGKLALLEVSASSYQKHDPAEGHTSKCLPPVRTSSLIGAGHTFSSMALDQNHDVIKGDGGAMGLTKNPAALLRWMVARPKIARLVNEFDEHNELTGIVHRMGNLVFDNGEDLFTLDSLVQTLKTAETVGQAQYDAFVQERCLV